MNTQRISQFIRSKAFLVIIGCFTILALVPLFITDNFFLTLLTLIIIFSIYASSWNLLASSGQGSLGHAVFLGIGGFASAIIGGTIATGLAAFMGVDRLPIGVLSVTIQVLSYGTGRFNIRRHRLTHRVSMRTAKSMVPCHGHIRLLGNS